MDVGSIRVNDKTDKRRLPPCIVRGCNGSSSVCVVFDTLKRASEWERTIERGVTVGIFTVVSFITCTCDDSESGDMIVLGANDDRCTGV